MTTSARGVMIHLARVKIAAGLYDQAQATLNAITNAAFADMKKRLQAKPGRSQKSAAGAEPGSGDQSR